MLYSHDSCTTFHHFPKNLKQASTFQAPEGWPEASSTLRTHKH